MVRVISKSAAKQRSGRAGRTRSGKCYRLYSEQFFEDMNFAKTPEILKMNMDHTILKLKQFKIKDVMSFDFIQKPEENVMRNAIENLKMLGALNEQEELTQIGIQISSLSIEPTLGRIILESFIRGCERQVTKIIALMINSNNLYLRGNNDKMKEEADYIKFDFCHSDGDFITLLQIFNTWESFIPEKGKEWCNQNFLNNKSLKQAQELLYEILPIVSMFKIKKIPTPTNFKASHKIEDEIGKCFLTGLFPNLSLYSGNSKLGYTFIRQMELIQIHGASSLALQGIFPKWIICTEINKYQYLSAKICNSIDISWIEEIVPMKYQKLYQIEQRHNVPLYNKIEYPKTGTTILNFMDRRNGRTEKLIEEYKIFFDIDKKNECLEAYTPLDIDFIKPKIDNIIEQIKSEFINDYYEYQIIGHTRALFGGGAEIKEILLGNQFKSLTFKGISFQNLHEIDQFFSEFGPVEKVRVFQNNNYSEGMVTMKSKDDAMNAEKILQERNEKYKESIRRSQNLADKPIRGRIKIAWFGGLSQSVGEVVYEENKCALEAMKNLLGMEIDGAIVSTKIAKKSKNKVIVSNLSSLTDESILEKSFKDFGSIGKIKWTSIFRENDFKQVDEELMKDDIKKILVNSGIPEQDIVSIQIKDYQNKHKCFRRKAFVAFVNPAHAITAKDKLDGKVGILGNQRVYIEPNFHKMCRFHEIRRFYPIELELYETIDNLKNQFSEDELHIKLSGNPYKKQQTFDSIPAIKCTGKDPLIINFAFEIINSLINPFCYELKTFGALKKVLSQAWKKLDQSMRTTYNCFTEIDRLRKQIKIYASPDTKEKIIDEIELFLDTQIIENIKISFKGKCVKSLFEKRAAQFKKIQDKYYDQGVEIDFSLIRKEIYIFGDKSITKKVEEELDYYII